MKNNIKIRQGLRLIFDLGACEKKKKIAGVHKREMAKRYKMTEKQIEPIIAALKTGGLIMTVGYDKNTYILSRPLEYI
ncbi:MAG: hypothetical protein V1904_10430 [Bacteroidota bacterium]